MYIREKLCGEVQAIAWTTGHRAARGCISRALLSFNAGSVCDVGTEAYVSLTSALANGACNPRKPRLGDWTETKKEKAG